ncbi:hypothetical protein SUDANB108_07017 [Streptomyces sp. enrichment culture]|uniref:hypothetical protein n=1 Tax=Streptomyces sp. enrichment culture TaxID=1795815 RepID=UPI003F562667
MAALMAGVPECGEDVPAGFSGRRSREVIEEHLARFGRHTTVDQVRRELAALNSGPDLPPVRPAPGAGQLLERLRRHGVAPVVAPAGTDASRRGRGPATERGANSSTRDGCRSGAGNRCG